MALRKNKIEILDSIIYKQELEEANRWMYYWDWDDDWDDFHDDYCDCYSCMPIDYEYLPDELQPKTITHISKRGIRITEQTWSPGKLIDMTSIYSKEVLRQKRINHILGIESMDHTPTTLGDILNIKK
jgi:hypothetical protein